MYKKDQSKLQRLCICPEYTCGTIFFWQVILKLITFMHSKPLLVMFIFTAKNKSSLLKMFLRVMCGLVVLFFPSLLAWLSNLWLAYLVRHPSRVMFFRLCNLCTSHQQWIWTCQLPSLPHTLQPFFPYLHVKSVCTLRSTLRVGDTIKSSMLLRKLEIRRRYFNVKLQLKLLMKRFWQETSSEMKQ